MDSFKNWGTPYANKDKIELKIQNDWSWEIILILRNTIWMQK